MTTAASPQAEERLAARRAQTLAKARRVRERNRRDARKAEHRRKLAELRQVQREERDAYAAYDRAVARENAAQSLDALTERAEESERLMNRALSLGARRRKLRREVGT